MIINTTKTVVGNSYKASLDVELTSLEKEYVEAYGEPKIDLRGTFSFSPASPQQAPGQIELGATADLGTPPVAGSATEEGGLGTGGLIVKGSGILPAALTDTIGTYHYAPEVISDFEFKATLLTVNDTLYDTATDPATVDGFRVGLALFAGDQSDDPSIILGWGSHNSVYNIALWQRSAAGGAYSEIASIAQASPHGLTFRLTRTSANLQAEYSLDGGAVWNTLGNVTLTLQTYRAGLLVGSGTADLATALFNGVSLTQTPVEDVNAFTIAGSEQVFMWSQSPHTFSLDGGVDPEAESKIEGWAAGIVSRLTAAKTDLIDNNDQPDSPNMTTVQV